PRRPGGARAPEPLRVRLRALPPRLDPGALRGGRGPALLPGARRRRPVRADARRARVLLPTPLAGGAPRLRRLRLLALSPGSPALGRARRAPAGADGRAPHRPGPADQALTTPGRARSAARRRPRTANHRHAVEIAYTQDVESAMPAAPIQRIRTQLRTT